MQTCAERIRQEPAAEELEVLLASFASFVMDANTIKQILRWDMKILRESPLFKELFKDYEQGLNEGLLRGRKEGWDEGIEEGREEGHEAALFTLCHFVAHRFGVSPDHFTHRLEALDLADIKQLTLITFDIATLAEFEAALARLEQAQSGIASQ